MNDAITEFIRSNIMEQITSTLYLKAYTKEEFEELLTEFIPLKDSQYFQISDELKWTYADPPLDQSLLISLSKVIYMILKIRKVIISYFQHPESHPMIDNLEISYLPEILKAYIFTPSLTNPNVLDINSPIDINGFPKCSRLNRYSLETIIGYSLYYHIYNRIDSSEKFYRLGSSTSSLHVSTNTLDEKIINDMDLTDDKYALRAILGVEDLPKTLNDSVFTGDIEIIKELETFRNVSPESLEVIKQFCSNEWKEIINDAILYETLIIKHYNQYGPDVFGVVLGIALGLLYQGCLDVDINIINIVRYEEYTYSIPKPPSTSFPVDSFYLYLCSESSVPDCLSSANYWKSHHDKIKSDYISTAEKLSNDPHELINDIIDWYVDNEHEPEFRKCIELIENTTYTKTGYLKPRITARDITKLNRIDHVVWIPETFNDIVISGGNCFLYSYFMRYMVDDSLLNTCSEKYKWLFVPFNELRFNNNIQNLNSLFPLAVNSIVENYDTATDHNYHDYVLDLNEEDHTLEHFNEDVYFINEYFNKKYGFAEGNEKDNDDAICIKFILSHRLYESPGLNACSRMFALFLLFRHMLKCQLGDSRINSIEIGNENTDESFTDFNVKQKTLDDGRHARVLYKLGIDLNALADTIKTDLYRAMTDVMIWIRVNHYIAATDDLSDYLIMDKVHDILMYAALFCIYKNVNEIKGAEKLDKIDFDSQINESDFISPDDIKAWINTSAPGCEPLFKDKPIFINMFYIPWYMFKFMRISDVWCIFDINEDLLIDTTLIHEFMGLTGKLIYALETFIVFDNKVSIEHDELKRISYEYNTDDKPLTGGSKPFSLQLFICFLLLCIIIVSIIVYYIYVIVKRKITNDVIDESD